MSAMMPVYNNEERKFRSGSVKRSTGMSHPILRYVTYDPTFDTHGAGNKNKRQFGVAHVI